MMDIGWLLVAELLALGVVTGFLAGLLGVGGGMMMVPFMTWILSSRGVEPGMAVKMAIATSMATILFTSVSSVRAHQARGAVRWDLVRSLAPGLVAGGLLAGAGLFAVLKGQGLALFFALFIGFSALQMLRDRKPAPSPADARRPRSRLRRWRHRPAVRAGRRRGRLPVGALHDLVQRPDPPGRRHQRRARLSDRAGEHGGLPHRRPIDAPRLARRLRLPVPAGPGHHRQCQHDIGSAGARVAHGSDTARLKRLFALLLFGLAAYMFYKSRSS